MNPGKVKHGTLCRNVFNIVKKGSHISEMVNIWECRHNDTVVAINFAGKNPDQTSFLKRNLFAQPSSSRRSATSWKVNHRQPSGYGANLQRSATTGNQSEKMRRNDSSEDIDAISFDANNQNLYYILGKMEFQNVYCESNIANKWFGQPTTWSCV